MFCLQPFNSESLLSLRTSYLKQKDYDITDITDITIMRLFFCMSVKLGLSL
jgi:hypothetical protein